LTFSLPLPLLQRLEFGMILVGMLLALVWLRSSFLRRKHSLLASPEDRLMALVSAVILLRILYDRPGSAQMGSSGGLGEAFNMGLGCVSYFMMARLTSMGEWTVRPTFRLAMVLLTIGAIIQGVLIGMEEGWETAIRGVFGLQLWFLSALALSWTLLRAKRREQTGTPQLLPYLVMAGTMILSAITPFRSRPVFAVAIVMTVAYVHGRLRRLGTVTLGGLALVMLLWYVGGSDRLPFVVTRSLSTIMPVSDDMAVEYASQFGSSSEVGWRSGFRADLNRMAWERIRERPLMGKGFTFTRDELVMQSYVSGSREEMMAHLAVSGIYHNVLVALAVFCGLPLALLFLLAYLFSLLKFIRFAPGIRDPEHRMLAAALVGFLVAESGQMLMNGGGRDFYYVCLLLGAMRGLRLLVAEREPGLEPVAASGKP
jgi:hypothetical protein